MSAARDAVTLLEAANGKRGELDGFLEVMGEPELAAAIIALAGQQKTTLREHFAGLAMQGLIAGGANLGAGEIASWALIHADALLAELAKVQP